MTADQCHRGYTLASDSSNGLMSLNPLYIRSIYIKKSPKFPKWTVAVTLDHSSIIDHSKNRFSSFSGMFQMLEDATWARLAMAMSALKGFEEDNNMLKKSTLSLSTISFQTKPVPQVCEGCCRNQRGQSDCSWFWRRPPHRYHVLFQKPWLRPSFFGKKESPITFSLLTMFQVV